MEEWDSWTRLERFLTEKGVEIAFGEYGAVCLFRGKGGKIDIYNMKNNNPDYEAGCVDVKRCDIKDLFAQLFNGRWELIFRAYAAFEDN